MQHFFIKKGATLPYLAVELIENGFNHYTEYYEKIVNATITFTMIEVDSNLAKIKCAETELIRVDNCDDNCYPKYYIIYRWTARDTRKAGVYKGYFEIDFLDGCGKLIAPISQDIIINILE